MFGILKEIFAFSGEKRKLLTKSMIVSFVGAVFAALQFLALMMTLDIIVGEKEAKILPVVIAMLVIDVRIGLVAIVGIIAYLAATEGSTRATKKTGAGRQQAQRSLVEAVLEYVQGMSVVKSYGLEKDNNQAASKAIDESSKKAIALTNCVMPWMGIRQVTARVFGVAIAVCALVFYFGGSMTLSNCILLLIASFMVYQQLENAGNMSDNLQMLGESMRTANAIDETPVMDIEGKEITPKDASIDF